MIELVDIIEGEVTELGLEAATITWTGVFAPELDNGPIERTPAAHTTIPLEHVHSDPLEAYYILTGVPINPKERHVKGQRAGDHRSPA